MISLFGNDVRVVGLLQNSSPDYFFKFFDVIAAGGIIVPLRSVDDTARIESCGVTEVITPTPGSGWIERTGKLPSSDRVAQIAFTSGTQGEPKGVILTQANLTDTVERLCEVMHLDSSIREYIGVPIYHSFGLGRCRAIAAVGGKAYLPRDGFNPREIARMLEASEINAISAVPTLWRSLLRSPEIIGQLGARVKWIEIGSQALTKEEKLAMRSLFPNARIVQHYGLTEASRTTFLDISRSGVDELESVGAPTGDIKLDVSDSGLIRIRGSNVAADLLIDGQKIPNTDNEGWFTTKDLGEIRNGNLYFLGRADDMINIGGLKVSAEYLESAISQSLNIPNEVSVVRIPDADRGESVLLSVTNGCAMGDDRILTSAQTALEQQGIKAGASIQLMRVDAFPRTDSGKVKRNELADIYATRGPTVLPQSIAGKKGQLGFFDLIRDTLGNLAGFGSKTGVREVFQEVFPTHRIGPDDSFVGLGGDSLTLIEMSMALEAVLGRLPDDWETMSLAQLERISPQRYLIKYVDTMILLRCIFVIAIVIIHEVERFWGAASALLVVSGFVFSKYQLRPLIASGDVKPILLTAARVAAPAILLILTIHTITFGFHPDRIFLFSIYTGNDGYTWYVEAYVQIMLILSFLFALPGIRAVALRGLKRFTLSAFSVALALGWVGYLLRDLPGLGVLFSRHAPYMVMWLFLLGCLIEQTSSITQKLAVLLLAPIATLLAWGLSTGPHIISTPFIWVWGGCFLLLFTDRIPVLFPLNWATYLISGASLFIYVTHWSVLRAWHEVVPIESFVLSNGLALIAALAAGIAIWMVWEGITGGFLKVIQFRGSQTRA